jgi:aarF domain-containing kinase
MSDFKSNRLSRFFALGVGLTKASASLAFDAAKTKIQSYETNDLTLKIKAANDLVLAMGELKGAMMKLGQMISISEDIFLPKEISDLFKDLQTNSPSMSMKDVDLVLVENFKVTSRELFLEFDSTPMACASIGQVHKARLKSGELVAVKIQYPKIVEAIKHDFQNLNQIDRLVQVLYPNKPNIDSIIEELKNSMEEECDYTHELKELQFFKKEYAELFPKIIIPHVYPEYSSSMVLTMEYLEGDSFEETLNYSQEERNELGKILLDSFLHSLWNMNRLHTDPQNGNYLFKRGRIIMLDFGSTRAFGDDFIFDYCHLILAIEQNSFESYCALSKKLDIFKNDEELELMQEHFALIQKIYLPYQKPGKFSVVPMNPFQLFKDMLAKIEFKGRTSPRKEFLLLDRSIFGLYTKLKAWKSEIEWLEAQNTFRNSIENKVKSSYKF